MNTNDTIMACAASEFDVVGVDCPDGDDNLLVLGMESTPERDLDDFGHEGKIFRLYGYEKFVVPRLNTLLACIRRLGFRAKPLGHCGYPLEGEVNLKEIAIRTGLGKRGKSSVVLHPKYGNRLRFIGLYTNAPLKVSAACNDEAAPACRDCRICLDICPVKVLEPFRLRDCIACLSNVTSLDKRGRSILCDLCVHECPQRLTDTNSSAMR